MNTGLVWYSNTRFVVGFQMVKYSNGGLKTGLKNPVYGPKCTEFKWSAMSHDFNIWIPETHTVRYSDESSIKVFGIQMVTIVSIDPMTWPLRDNVGQGDLISGLFSGSKIPFYSEFLPYKHPQAGFKPGS